MCKQLELFVNLEEVAPYNINIVDSCCLNGNRRETVFVPFIVHDKQAVCFLEDVLFVSMLS